MKVSASFLSSKHIPLTLTKLNETDVDYIHLDVMDGKFVSNRTMPFSEMKLIYKYTDKRLDVHLMCNDLEKYIKAYASLNCEYITIHVEADSDITKCLELIKSYSIKAGIAIKPDTPISSLVPYLPLVDLILVMSVEPGKGGQEFIRNSEARIEEVKALIKSYDLDIVVNVDGGVNDKTVKYCKECDIVTSGSYITNSNDYQETINTLR